MHIRILHSFETEALFLRYKVFIACSGYFEAIHTCISMCMHLQYQFACYHLSFNSSMSYHTPTILPSQEGKCGEARSFAMRANLDSAKSIELDTFAVEFWVGWCGMFFLGGLVGGWVKLEFVFSASVFFVFLQVVFLLIMKYSLKLMFHVHGHIRVSSSCQFLGTKLAAPNRKGQLEFSLPTRSGTQDLVYFEDDHSWEFASIWSSWGHPPPQTAFFTPLEDWKLMK